MLLGVLIVLYIGTQLAASMVTALSADPTQRRIMLALPFVFAVFIINFEAGLIVYWITTNVWTIGQQLLVKKLYPKPRAARARRTTTATATARRAASRRPPTAAARRSAGQEPGKAGAPRPRGKRGAGNGAASKPPPNPRKKKKRSGRRR